MGGDDDESVDSLLNDLNPEFKNEEMLYLFNGLESNDDPRWSTRLRDTPSSLTPPATLEGITPASQHPRPMLLEFEEPPSPSEPPIITAPRAVYMLPRRVDSRSSSSSSQPPDELPLAPRVTRQKRPISSLSHESAGASTSGVGSVESATTPSSPRAKAIKLTRKSARPTTSRMDPIEVDGVVHTPVCVHVEGTSKKQKDAAYKMCSICCYSCERLLPIIEGEHLPREEMCIWRIHRDRYKRDPCKTRYICDICNVPLCCQVRNINTGGQNMTCFEFYHLAPPELRDTSYHPSPAVFSILPQETWEMNYSEYFDGSRG